MIVDTSARLAKMFQEYQTKDSSDHSLVADLEGLHKVLQLQVDICIRTEVLLQEVLASLRSEREFQ